MPVRSTTKLREACCICKILNAEGDTDQIFEDHTHDCAAGCPRFASMPVNECLEYAKKAKLCLQNCNLKK